MFRIVERSEPGWLRFSLTTLAFSETSPVCFRPVFDEKGGLWLTGSAASIPSDGSSWLVNKGAGVPEHQRLFNLIAWKRGRVAAAPTRQLL